MTARPFVSCGPLDFQGHELLRNKPPDLGSLKLGDVPDRVGGGHEVLPKTDDKVFKDKDAWLHWTYVAAFALGVAALLCRRALLAVVALLGLAAVIAFLVGFNAALKRDDSPTGLSLEIGAILTLAGFAVATFDGVRQARAAPG
jgi:hypothetical protein